MKIKFEDRGAVLAALYNQAKTPGAPAWLEATIVPMSEERAQEFLGETGRDIDYLGSRPIKTDFGVPEDQDLDFRLYDRDHGGPGTGERAARAALDRKHSTKGG